MFHPQHPPRRQATMPDIGPLTLQVARRTTYYHLGEFGKCIDTPYLKYVCVFYSEFVTGEHFVR